MIDHNRDSKVSNFLKEYRQEIRFGLSFTIGIALAFTALHTSWVAENVSKPITVFEASIASKVLNVIGFDNRQDGLILYGSEGNKWNMQVLNTCNGLFESMIFLMAFLAIQIPWRKKLGWMTGGFLFFHIINETRLVSLFIVGSRFSYETFVFFHETFWNFAIIVVALSTFIFCAYHATKNPNMKVPEAGKS